MGRSGGGEPPLPTQGCTKYRRRSPGAMAKNSFFIRAKVTPGNSGTFVQSEIDLGSYTNLGSSKPEVLRILNIRAAMTNNGGEVPEMTTNTADVSSWQLTTQSQGGLVLLDDDSFIAGG